MDIFHIRPMCSKGLSLNLSSIRLPLPLHKLGRGCPGVCGRGHGRKGVENASRPLQPKGLAALLRLGMPVLLELPNFAAHAAACRRLGLHFVELNMNLPWCCPENLPAWEVRRVGVQAGLFFTLHFPEELDLGSFHPQLRHGALERVLQSLRWAADAGMEKATMHLNTGVYFTLPSGREWLYGVFEDQFLSAISESFEQIYHEARECGVVVAIENAGWEHTFIQHALSDLAELNGFWLTWDTGHNAASLYRHQPLLERYADRVIHVHLHDFDGARDHQPLYTGSVDIEHTLEWADERDLSVVLEVKTLEALEISVDALMERGLFTPI